jgi:hypothetical protein
MRRSGARARGSRKLRGNLVTPGSRLAG